MMNRIPVEDQGDYAVRAANGDNRAATALIQSLEGLTHQVAKRHQRNGICHEDLAQTARMAILDAARCYDADKGTPFPVVAKMRMRAACQKVVQANRPTSGDTRAMRAMFTSLPKAKVALAAKGLPATPAHVAAYLGFNEADVADAMGAASPHATSMESPVRGQDGDDRAFGDTLASDYMGQEERMERTELVYAIRDALDSFRSALEQARRPAHVAILDARILPVINGEDVMTAAELGTHLGLTKQRVGQIEKSLRARLAKRLTHLR